ncbi:BON domain-containing protein [Paraburkholderia sp. SIMBA_054]|uniref:BON domain-containing protein n=1 Tax=Paraburkholderia sp. SIMBA_054 TaxID=3085795 RepID=UPI003979AE4C
MMSRVASYLWMENNDERKDRNDRGLGSRRADAIGEHLGADRGRAEWRKRSGTCRQHANRYSTKADDRRLEKDVHHALGTTKHLTSIGIRVHADAGVVTLTGTVPNRVAVDRAASAAKGVPGVTQVRNNLMIQNKGR